MKGIAPGIHESGSPYEKDVGSDGWYSDGDCLVPHFSLCGTIDQVGFERIGLFQTGACGVFGESFHALQVSLNGNLGEQGRTSEIYGRPDSGGDARQADA